MPNINIQIDDELLREVNTARSRAGMTLKGWVTTWLEISLGWGGDGEGYGEGRSTGRATAARPLPEIATPVLKPQVLEVDGPNPAPSTKIKKLSATGRELVAGKKCWCGEDVFTVFNDVTRTVKWKCVGKGHFSSPSDGVYGKVGQ